MALGMTTIHSAEDMDRWNYKIKKRMKAAKGGCQNQGADYSGGGSIAFNHHGACE